MARDLAQELRESSGGWPQTWKPEVADMLLGRLVRTGTRTTKYGVTPVAVVEDDDGASWCVWLSTVLKKAFDEQRPLPGDRVGIQYNGKHELKGYHIHTLVVESAAPRPPQSARSSATPPASRVAPRAAATVTRGPAEADASDPFTD